MTASCISCTAFIVAAERTLNTSLWAPLFFECSQKGLVSELPSQDPPPLLRLDFTGPDRINKYFFQNIRAFNRSLAMSCVRANWVSRGPDSSSFNPTIAVHGCIYHFFEATVPPFSLRPSFVPVNNQDTDCVTQDDLGVAHMPNLYAGLFAQLALMICECNHIVQLFCASQNWSSSVNASNPNHMISHREKFPDSDHFRR